MVQVVISVEALNEYCKKVLAVLLAQPLGIREKLMQRRAGAVYEKILDGRVMVVKITFSSGGKKYNSDLLKKTNLELIKRSMASQGAWPSDYKAEVIVND